MTKDKNRNWVSIIALAISLIILAGCLWYVWGGFNNPEACYYETAELFKQEVRNNKLYMYVGGEVCEILRCGHFGVCQYKNRTLYFAEENRLRDDLDKTIRIKWCYVQQIEDYRIRGVTNIQ